MFQDFPHQVKTKITTFIKTGKMDRRHPIGGAQVQQSPLEQELMEAVNELDPLSQIDKVRVKKIVDEEEAKENYSYEKDNTFNTTEDEFEKIVQERHLRIEMEKVKNKMKAKIKTLQDHISFLEVVRNECNDNTQRLNLQHRKSSDRIEKLKYNFESMIYLLQGQVEVPQLPVATDYKDAILVKRSVIEEENREIVKRGDKKVELLEKIMNFKSELAKVERLKQKLDLEIYDLQERAIDVQMYRVKKTTQEII